MDISELDTAIENTDQIQASYGQNIPSGPGKTQLGAKLNNPYAVSNIEQALNEIYGQSFSLQPTYIYLRMKPDDIDDVLLIDALDLDYEDTPVDYEILYQGEYYFDDDIQAGEPGWLYMTVRADYDLPDIPYEILEEMVIPPYYSHLTYKAFQISGNEDKFEGFGNGDCHPDCFNWPECMEPNINCEGGAGDCAPGAPGWPCCDVVYAIQNPDECTEEPPGCYEGGPNWPECLDPPAPETACGCAHGAGINPNQPRGRVTVNDTSTDLIEGVRNIKVKAKRNGFLSFIWHSDYTDDNGCFHIDHSFSASSIKMKVVYKNDQAKIKALTQWGGIFAYRSQSETFDDSEYTDICFEIIRGGDNTIQTRNWQAATVINGIAEFHDWELPLIDQALNVWIDRNNDGAPMLGLGNIGQACSNEVILTNGEPILDQWEFAAQVVFINLEILVPPDLLTLYLPDIVLEDEELSDDFRSTIYHEMAHASHYFLAGECYWRKVRAHETFMTLATDQDPAFAADPYGDPNNIPTNPSPLYLNFPIVALTESWGEHIGHLYNVRKYTGTVRQNFWESELEALDLEDNIFIPNGLHHDLMDGLNPVDPSVVNGVNINDDVEGAQLLELYAYLTNETMIGFRTDVASSSSAAGSIIPLFNQYGF